MSTVTKNKLKLPDFLIIGSGKSGTTSLNNYLRQHPRIFIPEMKEPNFFGYELNTEKDFEGLPILEHYRKSVTDLESYLKMFEEARDDQLRGETSNTYLYHEKAPERILHYVPDVKLIAVFRHPVERLYSRYLHLARESRVPTKNFADCLDRSTVWWHRNDLIPEGFYYKHLSRYYKMFDPSSIRIFLYEDLSGDPLGLLQNIFQFLEIDENFKPDITINFNKSGFIRNKGYNRMFGQEGIVKKILSSTIPAKSYESLKSSLLVQKYLNRMRDINLRKPVLDKELKIKLTRGIYEKDIDQLSKLIDRDLSHWTSNP